MLDITYYLCPKDKHTMLSAYKIQFLSMLCTVRLQLGASSCIRMSRRFRAICVMVDIFLRHAWPACHHLIEVKLSLRIVLSLLKVCSAVYRTQFKGGIILSKLILIFGHNF